MDRAVPAWPGASLPSRVRQSTHPLHWSYPSRAQLPILPPPDPSRLTRRGRRTQARPRRLRRRMHRGAPLPVCTERQQPEDEEQDPSRLRVRPAEELRQLLDRPGQEPEDEERTEAAETALHVRPRMRITRPPARPVRSRPAARVASDARAGSSPGAPTDTGAQGCRPCLRSSGPGHPRRARGRARAARCRCGGSRGG